MSTARLALFLVCVAILPAGVSRAAVPPVDFNREVRPILSENCFYCHGQDPNHRKKDLRLDVGEVALKMKAVVPGKPGESGIVKRIFADGTDDLMPPKDSHRTLSSAQKETLKRWIAEGGQYQPHWTYVPPKRPTMPEVRRKEWVRNPIDALVLAKLEGLGLSPSPEADKVTLLRRVTLDLTGLPPTPSEVDLFVADQSPDAYERAVDRLLASSAYGERMALPWLDAARYADSNGFQQDGDTYQWIWRDWVVRSFNADMPFDQFATEQLAGDLLPGATADQKVATAFNRNHLLNGEGGAIAEEQRFNILFDRVDTTATTFLALTVACAQCHDHKYDPVTQRDYYSLMAAFNNVSEKGNPDLSSGGRIRLGAPVLEMPSPENVRQLASMESEMKRAEKASNSKAEFEKELAKWEPTATPETTEIDRNLQPILRMDPAKRTEEESKRLKPGLRNHFEKKVWPDIAKKDPNLKKANDLKAKIARYKSDEIPRVMVMADDKPRETFILDRGQYLQPKDPVQFATPGFLRPLPDGAPKNRLGFARWLFAPDHPLTARVQVNRYWQLFFGTGLVKTSEDLGVQSEAPLYPELLDWLAVEFREPAEVTAETKRLAGEETELEDACRGPRPWSVKHIHRLIVTSATYRQSSKVTPALLARDPENRLLARGSRFRMGSMVLRDVALASSGLVDRRVGGMPVYPYQPEGIWDALAITKERDFTYPASHGADLYRRSLYTFWRRTVAPADVFDGSNRQTCRVRLTVTSTPLHALTTLNDPTWAEAARVMAANAMRAVPCTLAVPQTETVDARLKHVYQRVLSREPGSEELPMLRRMLERQRSIYAADPKAAEAVTTVGESPKAERLNLTEHAAMSAVCLAVLNLDEALTHE